MKHTYYFISILVILFITHSAKAKLVSDSKSFASIDTVILTKNQVSKELVQLRDSIDNSILMINGKNKKDKSVHQQQLDKAYKELNLQKSQIEKVIEEVVSASDLTWDENIQSRAILQVSERRREYHQILNDIKDITNAKTYR